ncbi:MAG: transglutaminase domain-containing protein [Spartobacteria bacterium]|nr:transglutaminase domain-containing protein [Spartobacteria bacterium]
MKRIYTILIPSLIFWAVMTLWLIRYEAFPSFFSPVHHASYKSMLSDGPIIVDNWMKVLINGNHVGYAHSAVNIDEHNANERYAFVSKTVLRLSLLGSPQYISVDVTATLNSFYALQQFSMLLENANYSMKLDARRMNGSRFLAKMETPAGTQQFAVELPDDVAIYSPAMDAYIRKLKPDEQFVFKTLDPMTLTPMPMTVTAKGPQTFVQNGTQTIANLFIYDFNGAKSRTWMNDEGEVLLQETPWGWSMEASTPEKAVTFQRGNDTFDLARNFSVPLATQLSDSHSVSELIIDMEGAHISSFPLATRRQTILHQTNDSLRLQIQRHPPPDPQATYSPDDLAHTPFIQTTNTAIVARAQKITRHTTAPWEKAQAINDWVFQHVTKDPTVSIPSAIDVLKSLRGDCNEHTYLFVALARAAGIPSRITVGLVYSDGGLYYHAWPAVFIDGQWQEMDPTFGQHEADATHIALLQGELTDQMRLIPLIGQLHATIVRTNYD